MKHNIKINGEVKGIDCQFGSGVFDKNGREIFEGDDIGWADGTGESFEADYGVQFTAERFELRAPNFDY